MKAGHGAGDIDLSEMPGIEYGFVPIDVHFLQLHWDLKLRKAKRVEGLYDAHLFRLKKKLDNIPFTKEELFKKVPVLQDYPKYEAATAQHFHSYAMLPDMKERVYALFPPGQTGLAPLLYHPDLGEIYCVRINIAITNGGRVQICRYDYFQPEPCFTHDCICAFNWITGEHYYIGRPVYAFNFGPEHEKRAYPWTMESCREEDLLRVKNDHLMAFEHLYYWKKMHSEIAERLPSAEIPYGKLLEDAKEESFRHADALSVELGPISVMSAEEEQTRREAEGSKEISLPRRCDWSDIALCTSFLELLYDLPEGTLDESTHRILYKLTSGRGYGCAMGLYHNLLMYFGNLFQSVLQQASVNDWFVALCLNSLTGKAAPLQETDPSATSLAKWLGLSKPEFRAYMQEDDESQLVFWLVLNKIRPSTYTEARRTYEKVLEMNRMWTETHTELYMERRFKRMTVVYGKRNHRLFLTDKLPAAMGFYTKHRLWHWHTPYQYIKYIVAECKRAYDPEAGVFPTEGSMEQTLLDYNRMAHEILPSIGFILPHNLNAAHDSMVNNYNQIKAESHSTDEEVTALRKCYEGKEANVLEDPEFIVVAPRSPEDLYEEGILLNHCVGTYGDIIIPARGGILIYFLRPRSDPKHSLVTIRVDRLRTGKYEITEAAGKGNRELTAAERDACSRWIEEFNKGIAIAKKLRDETGVTSFDEQVLRWLETFDVEPTALPPYNLIHSISENYQTLFTAAAAHMKKLSADGNPLMDYSRVVEQWPEVVKHMRFPEEDAVAYLEILCGTSCAA